MVLIGDKSILSFRSYKDMFKQINSICKIKILTSYSKENVLTTGFLCKIKIPGFNFIFPVLITDAHPFYHIIDKKIEILFNNDELSKKIIIDDNSRLTFINNKYHIAIIEIKEYDGLDLNLFLDLDNSNFDLNKKRVYLLQYPKGNEISISTGIIKKSKDFIFYILALLKKVHLEVLS